MKRKQSQRISSYTHFLCVCCCCNQITAGAKALKKMYFPSMRKGICFPLTLLADMFGILVEHCLCNLYRRF